ncbi:MAG: SH3 domain-containing protein [Proteobacteria bacterium]|nr:SH3 domain-containing protein [Pseudomonadota bacterium]
MSTRRRRALALLVAAAAAAGAAGGEPLYVVEQVVVSVNANADGSGERVASLKSGERVELIERAGEAVHVRLADGKEGWLRAIYLSGDAPLRPRLAQSEAEVTRLQAQVARLEGQLAAAGNARRDPQPPAAAAAPADPPAPGGLFAPPPEDAPRAVVWPWVLLALLAGLAAGFVLGWRILDRNIRRKYGGLRIY